jgi:phosphate acetyltransferase
MTHAPAASLWDTFSQRVKQKPCRIVFPEGDDIRIIKAAAYLVREKLSFPVLLGDQKTIESMARKEGVVVDGVTIVNPAADPDKQGYIELLLDIRKHKNLQRADAEKMIVDSLIYGCVMLKTKRVNGFVGGSSRTTADTVRSGLIVLGVKPSVKTVSGSFLMDVPDCAYGFNGKFIFGDCAVVPHPTAEQLADIALESAHTFRMFLNQEPRIALLSYSTKGSAAGDLALDIIKNAVEIIRARKPAMLVDGELQGDAALDALVAAAKVKNNAADVAGKANVLIFPDLNSGNLAYKITQRLAKAEAIGPLLQGLNGAINDLSRGCTVDDIIHNALITSLEAAEMMP